MAFNRDALVAKVKKTTVAQTEANASTTSRQAGTEYLKRKARVGYRLMPTFNQAEGSYYAPVKTVSWLNIEVEKDDATKISRRPIFNSRVHLGTKDDIVERYVRFIEANPTAFDNYDDIHNAMAKDYKTSITPKSSRVAYALELNPDVLDDNGFPTIVNMGRLELKNSVWTELTDFTRDNDAHDKPLTYDAFDGVDDGRWFLCKYADKNYKVIIKDAMPIPDKYLQQLEAVDFLEDLFSYKSTDWDKQLEGLRNFDNDFSVGLFHSPEFQEIVQEVFDQVQGKLTQESPTTEGSEKASAKGKSTKASESEASDDDEDDSAAKAKVSAKIRDLLKANPDLKTKYKPTKSMTSNDLLGVLKNIESDIASQNAGEEEDDDFFEDEF